MLEKICTKFNRPFKKKKILEICFQENLASNKNQSSQSQIIQRWFTTKTSPRNTNQQGFRYLLQWHDFFHSVPIWSNSELLLYVPRHRKNCLQLCLSHKVRWLFLQKHNHNIRSDVSISIREKAVGMFSKVQVVVLALQGCSSWSAA